MSTEGFCKFVDDEIAKKKLELSKARSLKDKMKLQDEIQTLEILRKKVTP